MVLLDMSLGHRDTLRTTEDHGEIESRRAGRNRENEKELERKRKEFSRKAAKTQRGSTEDRRSKDWGLNKESPSTPLRAGRKAGN